MGLQRSQERRAKTLCTPCSLVLSIPRRMNSRTWTSSAPNLGLLLVAPQTGLSSSPQQPLQATPSLHCHPPSQLLWSQPVFLLQKQAFCSPLDWPQLQPQKLSPQPLGTMAQL